MVVQTIIFYALSMKLPRLGIFETRQGMEQTTLFQVVAKYLRLRGNLGPTGALCTDMSRMKGEKP